MSERTIRLLVDENVAGLARWFRFLGIDTRVAEAGTADDEVYRLARDEERLLVTRDGELARRLPDQAVQLTTDRVHEQIRAVLARVGVTVPEAWFRLCTSCNVPLRDLPPERVDADARIPSFIRESGDPDIHAGWECRECGRVFWKGSHYHRTREFLRRLVGQNERNQNDRRESSPP